MFMKDKLVKYNHKAIFYRFKKMMVSIGLVFACIVAISIPLSITLAVNESLAANRTSDDSTEVSSNDSQTNDTSVDGSTN